MWTTPEYKDRYSPASFLSDFSDQHTNNSHCKMRSIGEDYLADTDTEDPPSTDHVYLDRNSYCDEPNQNSYMSYASSRNSNYTYSSPCDKQPPQNNVFKCRQLPCRTFISTGSCPYGDRCVFLHPDGLVSKPVYIKTKRKSKEDNNSTDCFFWPTMSLNSVMGKTDGKNLPTIGQPYIVPTPSSYTQINSNNDCAVFSMWEHFLDFCKSDALSIVTLPRNIPPLNPFGYSNPYTGKKRLPVFMKLSQTGFA